MKSVIVDAKHLHDVDLDGETLIPPTLLEFATTFSDDLSTVLGVRVPVISGSRSAPGSLFITIGKSNQYIDAAGRATSEGYSLDVNSNGITVTGASPLGAWWGTRSLLQQAVLEKSQIPYGSAIDAPGWGVRGLFVILSHHFILDQDLHSYSLMSVVTITPQSL